MDQTAQQQSGLPEVQEPARTTQRQLRLDLSGLDVRQWPLFSKLFAAFALVIVSIVVTVTLSSIQRERQTFRAELEQQAAMILDTLSITAADSLYFVDVDTLEMVASRMLDNEDVLSVRFYNDEGRILASPDNPDLEGRLEADPYGMSLVEKEGPTLRWQADRLATGQSIYVGRQLLGAVSIELSTAALESKVAATTSQGLTVGVVAILLGAVAALLISQTITEPVGQLVSAVQRIAEGNLIEEVPIREGNDEIAVLGRAMEHMRSDLHKLYTHLEDQVAERTRELVIARDRAEEANRLKSQFLSTMSHELRTPLNAINGFTQIMLAGITGELNEKQRQNLERILANGEHLLGLVNDILDLAKIEAGHIALVNKPFVVKEWLGNVISRTQSLAEAKNLRFEAVVDEAMPAVVIGDSGRLGQVAYNLIGNAIKFTESGEVRVEIQRQGDHRWALIVKDSGIGIPPHALEYIFDEFRQGDESTTREYGGTGLGLSIVRKLALLMGGNVKVTSKVGEGSLFTVMLPLVTEQDGDMRTVV